jgi:hypothetical protein
LVAEIISETNGKPETPTKQPILLFEPTMKPDRVAALVEKQIPRAFSVARGTSLRALSAALGMTAKPASSGGKGRFVFRAIGRKSSYLWQLENPQRV